MAPPPEFPTVPQAARRLGVSRDLLHLAIQRGDLPSYRVGCRWRRVRWSEVLDWMRSCRVEPTETAEVRVAEILERMP